jgi:hypothetical protein
MVQVTKLRTMYCCDVSQFHSVRIVLSDTFWPKLGFYTDFKKTDMTSSKPLRWMNYHHMKLRYSDMCRGCETNKGRVEES